MAQHRFNTAQQQRRKAAARQKEAQRREADHLSRKHLSGLRVRQKNLVYVTGLRPKLAGDRLVEALRGKDYFGQYGDIVKIVVSKSKDAHVHQNQIVGIYITFVRKEDAATCIDCVDMSRQEDGSRIRAQYGTTKYCSAYLRGDTCTNKNCMFLHEAGDDDESFTRQDLSDLNAASTQQPAQTGARSGSPLPQAPPQQVHPVAAAVQDIEHATHSPVDNEGPALPAHASWADSARRTSRTTTTSIDSPRPPPPPLPVKKEQPQPQAESSSTERASVAVTMKSTASKPKKRFPYFDDLIKRAFDPNFTFVFKFPDSFSEKDRWIVENMPPLFDPTQAARRRLAREKEAQETASGQLDIEQDMTSLVTQDMVDVVDQSTGGSSQLGGEPEDQVNRVLSPRAISQQSAIGNSSLHHELDHTLGEELSGLGTDRLSSQQPNQQQQLFLQQVQKTSGQSAIPSQNVGHARQPSRFFLNEAMGTVSKNQTRQYHQAQQGTNSAQNVSGSAQFSFSNVQGPPPGLRSSGTTPVSAAGVFSQPQENPKPWDLNRGRSAGGLTDAGKRDFMTSPYAQFPSASTTPFQGALGFPYGGQSSSPFQDINNTQKQQKKKGKKHRHGNTSSSGGGNMDVSDPSILQMRVGNPMAGQAGFAGQTQTAFSSLHNNSFRSAW